MDDPDAAVPRDGVSARPAARSRRRRRRFGAAEAIADELRERILSGEIGTGWVLPKLEELTDEFGASKVTVREALRILETEGLVSVQRGNVGGALAHLPTPGNAAYTLSLVLEGRRVTTDDVARAIERLEPLCAELCAERPDRESAVLPALRKAQADLEESLEKGDSRSVAEACRRWHESLVANCGNETTAVVLGAIEAIWTAQIRAEGARSSAEGVPLAEALARRAYDEHAHIQRLIEAGDGVGAAEAARRHLGAAQPGAAVVVYPSAGDADVRVVDAVLTRDEVLG